jgi:hypothetical protein
MGEKELQEILRQARAAVAAGKSVTAVNQRVSELTQGQYPGVMSLALSVDPVVIQEEKEAERLEPLLEGSAAGDFLRTLGSGVTFGLSRGLPGAAGPPAGGEPQDQLRYGACRGGGLSDHAGPRRWLQGHPRSRRSPTHRNRRRGHRSSRWCCGGLRGRPVARRRGPAAWSARCAAGSTRDRRATSSAT